MTDLEKFSKILKDNGHRITQARLETFKLLRSREPMTMQQLLTYSDGELDRVSLYRNIQLFENIGVAHRVTMGWKYKIELSEVFVDHHHHLTCLNCGKVTAIDEGEIDMLVDSITDKYNFKPERHHFEIDGLCASCS